MIYVRATKYDAGIYLKDIFVRYNKYGDDDGALEYRSWGFRGLACITLAITGRVCGEMEAKFLLGELA